MAGMEFTFTGDTAGLVAALEAAIGPAKELEEALHGDRDAALELGAAGGEIAPGLAAEAAAMDAAAESSKSLRAEHSKMIKAASLLTKATEDVEGSSSGLGKTLRKQKRDQDDVARSIADLEKASRDGGIGSRMAFHDAEAGVDGYLSKIQEARKALQDASAGIDDLQHATSRHEISAISAAHGLKDGSRDARDFSASLKGVEKVADDVGGGGGGGLLGKILGLGGGIDGGASKLKDLVLSPMAGLIAGVVGLAAGAVPAVLSLGAGFGAFGAMAAPALYKVKTGLSDVAYAQQQYDIAKGVEKRDPSKSNLENEQKTLAALKTTYADMPAPVRGAVRAVQSFEKAWGAASKKAGIQKDALGDIKGLLHDAQDAIPAVTKLAKATAPIVHGMVTGLGKEFRSDGFKSFIKTLTRDEAPAAHALKGIGSAMGGFVTQLTAKESKPGTAMLTSIGKFLKDVTPGAVSGLTGLTKGVTGLVNGMDAVANSKGVSMLTGLVRNFAAIANNKPGESKHLADNLLSTIGLHPGSGNAVPVRVKPHLVWSSADRKFELTGGKALTVPVHAKLAGSGIQGLKGPHTVIPVTIKPKVTGDNLAHALQQAQNLKGAGEHAIPVKTKVDAADVSSQISKATSGKNIAVKGKVTLSGLGAGIQQQVAHLHIPDSKVKISVQVSGVGAVKSQMAGVVSAARSDASAAKGALSSLAGAGQAAGGALSAGLAAGIKAGEGAVVAAATAVASAAAAAVRAASGIQSPSKVWKGIGKNMTEGLVLGLEGGKAAVDAASRMLTGAAKPNGEITATIKKLRKDVREAFGHNKITGGQEDNLLNQIDIGNRRLQGLVNRRQHLMGEIKAAQALAKSVRQGAIGYADVTGIAAADSAGQQAQANPPSAPSSIQQGQKADLHNIKAFTADIKRLKKEGLDKQSIKQLLAAGVSGGLPAAEQLLASGKKGVKESARLQKEIIAASKKLGVTGANAAYESGSDIGKGLAAGLKSELGSVVKAIDHLAKELVNEIRKSLGLPPLPAGGGKGHGGHGGGGHGGPGHHKPPVYKPGGGDLFDHGGGGGLRVHPGRSGGPAHGTPIIVHVQNNTYLDGAQVASSNRVHTLRHARRNVSSGLKLPNRGN